MTQADTIRELRSQRRWLIEQLAGAWGWTEQEVSERLYKDTALKDHRKVQQP